jgi:hypothetical protein
VIGNTKYQPTNNTIQDNKNKKQNTIQNTRGVIPSKTHKSEQKEIFNHSKMMEKYFFSSNSSIYHLMTVSH